MDFQVAQSELAPRDQLRNSPMRGETELCQLIWPECSECYLLCLAQVESNTAAVTLHLLSEPACSEPALIFPHSGTLSV